MQYFCMGRESMQEDSVWNILVGDYLVEKMVQQLDGALGLKYPNRNVLEIWEGNQIGRAHV